MRPRETIALLQTELAAKTDENAALRDANRELQINLEILRKELFAPKRERTVVSVEGQQSLFGIPVETAGEPPPAAADAMAAGDAADDTQTITYERKKCRGRKAVPADLPIIEHVIPVPAADRIGPDGTPLVLVGYEVSERIDLIPERLVRLVIKRERYGDPTTRETVITAPPLAALIPKGKLSDAFIIEIAVRKYLLGLPLYRQAEDLTRRLGDGLSRSTLTDAVNRSAEIYRPIVDAMWSHLRQERILFADETPIRQLRAQNSTITGYFWAFLGGDHVVFHYAPSRAQRVITALFGVDDAHDGGEPWDPGALIAVMCDGYAGYNPLFAPDAGPPLMRDGDGTVALPRRPQRLACWAHVRRKFHDLMEPYQHARELHAACNAVFRVERQITKDLARQPRAAVADACAYRRDIRQRDGVVAVAAVKHLLDTYAPHYPPNTAMAKAIAYAQRLWDSLIAYLDSGDLPMSNNDCERAIRPIAVGRKNYLFVGSEDGGQHAAIWYSLIESCRKLGIDPRRYFAAVTPRLVGGDPVDPAALTPRALRDELQRPISTP